MCIFGNCNFEAKLTSHWNKLKLKIVGRKNVYSSKVHVIKITCVGSFSFLMTTFYWEKFSFGQYAVSSNLHISIWTICYVIKSSYLHLDTMLCYQIIIFGGTFSFWYQLYKQPMWLDLPSRFSCVSAQDTF